MSKFTTPKTKKNRSSFNNNLPTDPLSLNRSDNIPIEVDREILRGVAFFGAVDSNINFFQRNESFQFFSPPVKRAVRVRNKYMESVQTDDYPRFLSYCHAYNIRLSEEEIEESESPNDEPLFQQPNNEQVSSTPRTKQKEEMSLPPYFQSPNGRSPSIPEYCLKIGNESGDASYLTGVLAYKSPPFVNGDELVTALVIIKHIPDLADARSDFPMTMTLLLDGTGAVVVEPSMSDFLKHMPPVLYADCPTEMKNAFETAHALAVTANEEATTETYIIRFPDGMVGRMGGMNPEANGRTLTGGNVTITQTFVKNMNFKKKDTPFTHVTQRYVVLPESKEPKLLRRKQTKTMNNIDDLLQDAFSTLEVHIDTTISFTPPVPPPVPKPSSSIAASESRKASTELIEFLPWGNSPMLDDGIEPLLEEHHPWSFSHGCTDLMKLDEIANKRLVNGEKKDLVEEDHEEDQQGVLICVPQQGEDDTSYETPKSKTNRLSLENETSLN